MGKRGPAPGSPPRGGRLYKPTPGDFLRHLDHVHMGVWARRGCKVCRLKMHSVKQQWAVPEGTIQEELVTKA